MTGLAIFDQMCLGMMQLLRRSAGTQSVLGVLNVSTTVFGALPTLADTRPCGLHSPLMSSAGYFWSS